MLAIRAAELAVNGTDATIDGHGNDDEWGLIAKNAGNRVRQLTVAGALIAAEIDRILRMEAAS